MNATAIKKETRLKSLKKLSKKIVKGKAFRKDEFGTSLFDMTIRGALSRRYNRPDGHREAPVKLSLRPVAAHHGTCIQPTRIFIGSEPSQHRAERVLLWSILKHRNPKRHYEVHIMKDLVGFDRKMWKTGFTAYRYAVPEFAGFQGRAIYNDVDQIYLDDPAVLFAEEMGEAAVLAVDSRDTSVMLIDCGRLKDIWTRSVIHTAPEGKIHASMLKIVQDRTLIASLSGQWNSRDHEYDQKTSKLLHYTILHTQPWKPFPEDLRYRKNPWGGLWFALEAEADEQGFAPLWKHHSDRPYNDMKDFFDLTTDKQAST